MSKGTRREREAHELYSRAGWMTYRPATVTYGENDLFGLFDILAINPSDGSAEAVQVKSNGTRGITAWSRHTWPFRAAGWTTVYLVPYDNAGWKYVRVDDAGQWSCPVDERNESCKMGEHVVEFLKP